MLMGEREEDEGLLRETERKDEVTQVDPSKDHYPMCIIWSPIPMLSYFTPIIGHAGIVLSDGTINDFGASYYIHVKNKFSHILRFVYISCSNFKEKQAQDSIWERCEVP